MPPTLTVGGVNDLASVGAQVVLVTALLSIVTAPVRAKALPDKAALVFKVTLASARILPMNEVPMPSVAELPACQNAPQSCTPLIVRTAAWLAVISLLPI